MLGSSRLVIYILIAIIVLAFLMLVTNLLRCYFRKPPRNEFNEISDTL